ncbi:MAG: ATP-binding protein, partial [Nannocystaceae bacterium]
LSQLTAGIQALHAHERLHRDLKPSNVMVSYADERVVILDFGLVDYTDHSEATLSSEGPVGTPQYMAPEQTIASRGCTPATDWYAVGVMIFEAVTGKLPISGRTLFELVSRKQLNDPPRMSSLVRGVPPSLDDLVARLLSREPTERPNAAELRAWCSDQDNTATFDSETSPSTTVLLGRASAVAQICQAFNAVLSKQPRCLIAHGPSGTGKSALIRHVLRQLETTTPDILLLRGICYEHETVPYRAFDQVIEDLARYLASLPKQERSSLLPARMSHLLDLFPVLRHIPGVERRAQADEEPVAKNHQEQRRQAFYELKHLLFNVASVHNLVLFLDDLHASDNDSARLLSELLAPPYQPPMLLVGACRSQSPAEIPFLEDFFALVKTAELQNIEFIEIGPLPHAQAVRVAAQLLSDRGLYRPRYAELLASSCAGNSSLMDQIVSLIKIPSGPSNGQVELDEELFSLENIISRRLQGLHAEARRVLMALAVGGTPITAEVIAQVANTTANIHALLQQLLDQNFVYTHERDGTVLASCFNQSLRDAILAQVGEETRQELHFALATAFMEDLPASAKVCAHHLIASGNQEQAVEHLETAALAARGALAFEQAAELYRVALRCAPNNHGLELKLAQALELAGH